MNIAWGRLRPQALFTKRKRKRTRKRAGRRNKLPSSCPSCVLLRMAPRRMARRARGARRDITRGAGKSKGLGQGGTAEPGSAEPGIVYLRTLDCLQQGNKKVGGETKTWDECNGSSARLGVRGRARVRVLESEVEDGFESKFEFEFESSRSSSR